MQNRPRVFLILTLCLMLLALPASSFSQAPPQKTATGSGSESAPQLPPDITVYCGDPETKVYYPLGCTACGKNKCRVLFTSRDDAEKLGYKPCKDCPQ